MPACRSCGAASSPTETDFDKVHPDLEAEARHKCVCERPIKAHRLTTSVVISAQPRKHTHTHVIDLTELGMMRLPHDCSGSRSNRARAATFLSTCSRFMQMKLFVWLLFISSDVIARGSAVVSLKEPFGGDDSSTDDRLFSLLHPVFNFRWVELHSPLVSTLLHHKLHTKNHCRDVMLLGNTWETWLEGLGLPPGSTPLMSPALRPRLAVVSDVLLS